MTTADPCFAVSGATGAVGRAVLEALAVARPASKRVLALASAESVDDTVGFGRHELSVLDTATQDPAAIDILVHAAGSLGTLTPVGRRPASVEPEVAIPMEPTRRTWPSSIPQPIW